MLRRPALRAAAAELLRLALMLWLLATLAFFLLAWAPGDALGDVLLEADIRQAGEHRLGLDRPLYVQYLDWLSALLHGDLGRSLQSQRPVRQILWTALGPTLLLSSVTLGTALSVGIASGIGLALGHGRPITRAFDAVTLGLWALPSFFVALVLQAAAPHLGLPSDGLHDLLNHSRMGPLQQLLDTLQHLVLPGAAMGLVASAFVARFLRQSLLHQLGQPYLTGLRARGLSEPAVLRHALRNALLPVLTLVGLSLPYLVGGGVVVESIFQVPGIGWVLLQAIGRHDTPVVLGAFLWLATATLLGNRGADALTHLLDPRTRRG